MHPNLRILHSTNVPSGQNDLAGRCICCGERWCICWVVDGYPDSVSGGSGFDANSTTTYIASGMESAPAGSVHHTHGDGVTSGTYIPDHMCANASRSTNATEATTMPTSATNTLQPHNVASISSSSSSQDQHPSRLEQRHTGAGGLITILPQEQHRTRLLMVTLHPPIDFHGCSLLRALLGETSDLVYRDVAAFGAAVSLPQKMSVILMFPGHARYSRQVNILRARQTAPTRAQLAVIIAREVLRFLQKAREGGSQLQFEGHAVVDLRDLVLVEVRHVSKSSLQHVIGIVHH